MGDVLHLIPEPPPCNSVRLKKLYPIHLAMIEFLVLNPSASRAILARHFNYSATQIHIVMNSPCFQEELRLRMRDITDPEVMLTVRQKLEGIGFESLDILEKRLARDAEEKVSDNLLLRALDIAMRGMGYGGSERHTNVQVNVENNLDVLAGRLVHLLEQKKQEAADQTEPRAKEAG